MRSPAAAIAWEFRRRHRWGLLALSAYLLVLAAIKIGMPQAQPTVTIDSAERFATVVVIPLTVTFVYVLAVFTFGLSGDLAARQSIYPARMFTLPVTSAALAGWPMLYGCLTMLMLWMVMRFLGAWPSGFDIPRFWPALMAMSLLAWTQALVWMPYGARGARVVVTVLWLATIDTIMLVTLHYGAGERRMLAILAPHVPLAYLAARGAVARARRGDMPDWSRAFSRPRRTSAPRVLAFASPARAQLWFEWRSHGRSLPALVGMVLPFELALLRLAAGSTALVVVILIGVLLTPPFMAAFAAPTVRRSHPGASESVGLSPFTATRPMTSAALIAAKLRAAARSTVAAWLIVAIAVPIGLVWSNTLPMVIDRAGRFADIVGVPRALVFALVLLAGLLTSTWKQLVQGLYVRLTGRVWLVRANIAATLLVLSAAGPLAVWIVENGNVGRALWNWLPTILSILVCTKMAAAVWVVARLDGRRVLSDRTLVTAALSWTFAVLGLYVLLSWLLLGPFLPRYLLGLAAILVVPLARLSAAPLALDWNRHR